MNRDYFMTPPNVEYDNILKTVLIGDSGVGKTALLCRYIDSKYNESYISTIGIDFRIKTLLHNGRLVKLHVWDTAGHERFRTMTSAFFRGSHGVFVVFSLEDQSSFDKLDEWMQDIERNFLTEPVLMLVGNKHDLSPDQRIIEQQIAQEYAENNHMTYIETSAKTDYNVDSLFHEMIDTVLKLNATATLEPPSKNYGSLRLNRSSRMGSCCNSQ